MCSGASDSSAFVKVILMQLQNGRQFTLELESKFYWMLTSLLLNQESYQALTVILQGVNKGKGYSLIPNWWDWETHWKQSKKNWKNKTLTCEIFFQHSRRNSVSPHSHVICFVHCMDCSFFFFGWGGVIFVVSFHCT